MSIFAAVPWKAVASAVPLLADLVFRSDISCAAEKEQKEIEALKAQLKTIDSEINSLYKAAKILLAGLIVVFLVAVSALIVGIVAMSN